MTCTDSEHSSNEQDKLSQDAIRTPLSEDSHQDSLMLAAYREVGSDFSGGQWPTCEGAGDPALL